MTYAEFLVQLQKSIEKAVPVAQVIVMFVPPTDHRYLLGSSFSGYRSQSGIIHDVSVNKYLITVWRHTQDVSKGTFHREAFTAWNHTSDVSKDTFHHLTVTASVQPYIRIQLSAKRYFIS